MLLAAILAIQTAALPPVQINHCLLVLDPGTYKAVSGSEYINKDFCNSTGHHTDAGLGSYTGFYLLGKSTYLELFVSGEDMQLGDAAVGFSVERIGSADQIYRKMLTVDSVNARQYHQTSKGKQGQTIPWFDSYAFDGSSHLSVWVMDFRREDYASSGKLYSAAAAVPKNAWIKPPRMMGDILQVDLGVDETDKSVGAKTLSVFGLRKMEDWSETKFDGPDVSVVLRDKSPFQIQTMRHIKLSLVKSPAHEEAHRLGRSVLHVHPNGTADWDFD